MKIDRAKVYLKYGGRCAYCGVMLKSPKEMQIDHIIPKSRSQYMDTPVNDFSNLNPACKSCNYYKTSYTVEEFRHLIKTLHDRIIISFINRVAINYGVITVTPFDGVFYFEKYNKEIQKQ